jgi:hypothetical protein
MRATTLLLPICGFLFLTACGSRQDLVPDRGQHAMRFGTGLGGVAAARDFGPSQSGPPKAGETVVTFGPGDRLYKIAEAHNVDLAWLIKRNDLTAQPRPGQQIVVPQGRSLGR